MFDSDHFWSLGLVCLQASQSELLVPWQAEPCPSGGFDPRSLVCPGSVRLLTFQLLANFRFHCFHSMKAQIQSGAENSLSAD
jgi:hypothetical protein